MIFEKREKDSEIARLREELSRLKKEKEFDRAHRLAMGTLTLGIAHEILNPLAVLYSEMEIIKYQPRDKEFLQKYYEKNVKYIDRIKNIVERISDLARVEKKSTESLLDLNRTIETSFTHLNVGSGIEIVKKFSEIPKIMGIVEDLEKAFYQILSNSVHAMPDGGTITVATAQSGGKVQIMIEDAGVGIAEENLERIFDPFWSSRHEAAGLGLPTAYRIVKDHGGELNVSSKVGVGTTVTMTFNAAK